MARRDAGPDPKEAALAETRCLNPHPEQVRDPAFASSDYFDARDVVQVKYEMVRKVNAGGVPVTEAAAAFGYSRPSYYEAAAALERSGLEGLVRARPGPRHPGSRGACQAERGRHDRRAAVRRAAVRRAEGLRKLGQGRN